MAGNPSHCFTRYLFGWGLQPRASLRYALGFVRAAALRLWFSDGNSKIGNGVTPPGCQAQERLFHYTNSKNVLVGDGRGMSFHLREGKDNPILR